MSDISVGVLMSTDGAQLYPAGPDPRRMVELWSAELDGLDVTSATVAVTLQRLAQRVERAVVAIARSHGLGPGDLRVLLALRRGGPPHAVSPTELFRLLLITSGAVSKQVDRLVEVGLVARMPDPEKLRGLLVRLEPAGRAVADAAMKEISSSFVGLERLSVEQKHEILAMLGRLQVVMEGAASHSLSTPAPEGVR
jgi:DNA-binding MarR family transcriptional regulator